MVKTKNITKSISTQLGFTMIELLVVISIIGVLTAVILPNMVGMRERARDSQKKSALNELRTSLRLFYNDFQTYPSDDSLGGIQGCGAGIGNDATFCQEGGEFSTNDYVYMKELPEDYYYEQVDNGDGFFVYSILENASDESITDSASRCGIDSPEENAYYVCAN